MSLSSKPLSPLHGGHVPGHAAYGQLTPNEMNEETYTAASNIRSPAVLGEIIILIVYLPLLALAGILNLGCGPMMSVRALSRFTASTNTFLQE